MLRILFGRDSRRNRAAPIAGQAKMVGLLTAAPLMFVSSLAFAVGGFDVIGPTGITLPVLGASQTCGTVSTEWGNVQPCLDRNEMALGATMAGQINAQGDATVDQEVFEPQCQLKFKVIQRGGDYASVFGWYPASDPPVAPALKDMHVMLTCKNMEDPTKPGVDMTDPIGTEKVLSVPPGTGKVGFFMSNDLFQCDGMIAADGATPPGEILAKLGANTAYSQKALNKGPMNNFMVLQWQSVQDPDAFYFGWEDNFDGTDNDFEDLVTLVTGVDCAEGGKACETELIGICKPGTEQCRAGGLVCVPDNDPQGEKCNAIDDDCNGVTDDGDTLCPPSKVCIDGVCVGDCSSGEFPCPAGFSCEPGADTKFRCVELACVGKTCPEGERCVGGQCIGDCKDVVCPWGQNCQSGVCVPACEGLVCDMGFVCVVQPDMTTGKSRGVCQTCPCKGCPDGTTCDAGYCRPNDCVGQTCAAGTHCEAGGCVDDCAGTVCPFGGTCTNGVCSGGGGAGGSGGTGTTGGTGAVAGTIDPGTGGLGTGGSGAGVGTGGTDPGAGGTNDDDDRRDKTTSGCGCRVQGQPASGVAAWLLAGLGLAVAARRRGRR